MIDYSIRLLNIGLRAATLGTRFLLIFFLAKYLEPSAVGYYGLFSATIAYAIFFVGLDFYTFVSREIVRAHPGERAQMLKAHMMLSCLLYLALIPFGIWLLLKTNWPVILILWFVPILFLEHLNQEVSRLLIALSEQLTASVIIFIRQGVWVIVLILFMHLDETMRSLNTVLFLWAISGIIAACVGIIKLTKLKFGGWALPIDWSWLKKGIAVSAALLISTLALRAIFTIDRYWVESIGGIEVVGAYVLLLGIAGALNVFLDSAVFAFSYPNLIKLNHENRHQAARVLVRRLLLETVILCSLFSIVSLILLPYLLDWINNPLYKDNAAWYPWLLAATVIGALGKVPHYALYSIGRDGSIILSHIFALFVFILTVYLFFRNYSVFSVFIGLNLAFLFVLIWKSFAYFWYLRNISSDS